MVVWRLDRLGRYLKELIEVVGGLEGRGVEFEKRLGRAREAQVGGRDERKSA